MIPKELDDLIKEYLTDGIISAKERQVLLKKAEQLGLDRDEVDLYIDAQQQKADQAVDAVASKKRGKTCPFCGGTVPQLVDKCPHCGETITAEASEELQEIFDNLEEALVDFKSGKDIAKSKATVERYVRKAKMYYENNPKVQKLLAEVESESEKKTKEINSSARSKGFKKIVILGILAVIACGCVYGAWQLWQEHRTAEKEQMIAKDPGAATDAINNAIESGDLQKAESYISAFSGKNLTNADDIVSAVVALADALVKNKEYDKALSLDEYLNTGSLTFIPAVCSKLIEAGEYHKAMGKMLSFTHKGDEKALSAMRECIIRMKSNNTSPDEIKQFIDSYYGPGSGYEDSLYKLAGV